MGKGSIERSQYVDKFGWCRIFEKNLETISKYSAFIVEIGAGSGYLRHRLISKFPSLNIHSYDLKFEKDTSRTFIDDWNELPWESHVIQGNETVLDTYDPKYSLLMVWPPPHNDMASNALKLFKGEYLIFIGEARGGMCANESFFDTLDQSWTLVHQEPVDSFDHFRDQLYILKRFNSNDDKEIIRMTPIPSKDNEERSIRLKLDEITALLSSKDIEDVYNANEKMFGVFKSIMTVSSLSVEVRNELNTLAKEKGKEMEKIMFNKVPFDQDPFSTPGAVDVENHPLIPSQCGTCGHPRLPLNETFKVFNKYNELVVQCRNCKSSK